MNNGQYKRLILAVFFVILLLVVAIVLLVSVINKPKDIQVNNYAGKDGSSAYQLATQDGFKGSLNDWLLSLGGKDSVSTNTVVEKPTVINTTRQVNVPVPGPKGETGEPGPAGQPSPQILIKVDPITCKLLTKYDGDDYWNTLAQLPKPCAAEGSNE